ncbi:MAG: GNAT family N-acetyltransferase [Chloroflexi bacterium OHK40]
MEMSIRPATTDDIPALTALVDAAVRGLGASAYSLQQIESALQHVFGADTAQLIADGTYFVALIDGQLVGAGGWSRRASLHGSGQAVAAFLDPARDAAKIRAFYVHPRWSRRGIGRRLLQCCEAAARAVGFMRLELLATLTGVPLYTASGFVATTSVVLTLPDGVTFPCVQMAKALQPQPSTPPQEHARRPWATA